MTTKVQEIVDRPERPRRDCPICTPQPGRVRLDQLWGVAQKVHVREDGKLAVWSWNGG